MHGRFPHVRYLCDEDGNRDISKTPGGRMLDEKKITFITCVNDEEEYAECRYYLNRLSVPEGYMMILSVYGKRHLWRLVIMPG